MSTLRSILLHIDPSPCSMQRLALAHAIAAWHDARITAMYASTPTALSLPFVMGQGAAEMLPMLQQLDIDYRDSIRAAFDRAESLATAPLAWNELGESPLIAGFARHALFADLLVLGQHDASDLLTTGVPSDFVASVMIASGRPALVVPYVGLGKTLAEEVLIAWKPTRECARALSAAIPFLQRTKRIHLAVADGDVSVDGQARALEDYLRPHGVKAPIQQRVAVPAGDSGDALLSMATDVGADLLVMGCYGHSRTRELMLGGATRTVLRSMTLPVLMAH